MDDHRKKMNALMNELLRNFLPLLSGQQSMETNVITHTHV